MSQWKTLKALFINIFWYMWCSCFAVWSFCWENAAFFKDLTFSHFLELCGGGLYFDTSAIMYANALFILLFLFPLHWKEVPAYHKFVKWLYVIVNTLCVVANLMDTVYFQFTNRRTTCSVFSQFANEDNLGRIIGIEFVNHWYLVLLTAVIAFLLYRLYQLPAARCASPCPPITYRIPCSCWPVRRSSSSV